MSAMIDPRLADWFASDDTGASSKAIALWLSAGVKHDAWGASTPSDPADLARCLRLLERVPEFKDRMGEMIDAGGLWPTFARRWPEMVTSFMAECRGTLPAKGDQWSCPLTYALMKAVHDEAYANDRPDFVEVSLGCVTMRMSS